MGYNEYWEQIYSISEELNSLITAYWDDYSNLSSWQFWVVLFIMIIPLVILYFTVDRQRIFELFFFGFIVHMLWSYCDTILSLYKYFVHTYFLTPLLPYAQNMTTSLLPVSFILLYQYCTKHKKNFYLYTLFLSAFFALLGTPIEEYFGFVKFDKGLLPLHIFFIDVAIAYIAYWGTKFVLSLNQRSEKNK
ncbi:hypothetical protein [Gracilibacillus dipsosauri]|uniref:Uncharacterized protein n=1 Tax=Gracilibacillus dipsosauri TaxID=178340 RepID=A0A317L4W9_9BACI|nr:hypothetical protein [Gracilibacillus dipsosauri]PWU70334.1 hypothetical protein DLJ74_00390 [Gracilibacillus dipsosauri]